MDSVVQEWNTILTGEAMSLDLNRPSLEKLIRTALPENIKNGIATIINAQDSLIKSKLLKNLGWDEKRLDSLVLTDAEKSELQQQIGNLQTEVDKVSGILKGPDYLTGALKDRFYLQAEWQESDQVRYVLYEKIIAPDKPDFITRRSTGLSTPWVNIPVNSWEQKLADFENYWKSTHENLVFSFEKAFNDWLISHGFPGLTELKGGFHELENGIAFNWLGQKWRLDLFGNITIPSANENLILLNELDNPEYWKGQIENLGRKLWEDKKDSLLQAVNGKWQLLISDFDALSGKNFEVSYLNSSLTFQYNLGHIDGNLSGAILTYTYKNGKWTDDFHVTSNVISDNLERMIPGLRLEKIGLANSWNAFYTLMSGKELLLGELMVDKNGKINFTSQAEDIEIDFIDGLLVKIDDVLFDETKIVFDDLVIRSTPEDTYLKGLLGNSGDISWTVEYNPTLKIKVDDETEKLFAKSVTDALNGQGLLPPGVKIVGLEINEKGIYPRFDTSGLEGDLKQTVENITDQLETVSSELINSEEIQQIGEKVEAIRDQYDVIANSPVVEKLKIIRDAINAPDNVTKVAALMGLVNDDDRIVLANGFEIELDERNSKLRGLELFGGVFGCTNSYLYVDLTEEPFEPELGQCLKAFIEDKFLLGDVDDGKITFDSEKLRFVLSNFAEAPIEMYVTLEGDISWNYSEEKVKELFLKPVEEELKKQAEQLIANLNLDPTKEFENLASDLFRSWEQVINGLGFNIGNRDALQQAIKNAGSVEKLAKTELSATLVATNEYLEGVTISGVILPVQKVLTPDFSKAVANLEPLKNKINSWAGGSVSVSELKMSKGKIFGSVEVTISSFQPIPVPFSIDLNKADVSLLSWKKIMTGVMVTVINKKMAGSRLGNKDVVLILKDAVANYPEVAINVEMSIAVKDNLKVPVPAILTFNVESGKFKIDPQGNLEAILGSVANQLLQVLSFPFLDKKDWIEEVSLYPAGQPIPEGILVRGKIDLEDFATIVLPGIIMTNNGIKLEKDGIIEVSFNAADISVPPFRITDPGGSIAGSEISIFAKLTLLPPKSEELIYAKGAFIFDFKEPLIWRTRTDIIAFDFINMGYSESILDLKSGIYDMKREFGGPLKDYISLDGRGRIEAKGPKVFGDGKVDIFGSSIAKGNLYINLSNQVIVANSEIRIPVVGHDIDSHFKTEKHFSNPTVSASESIKVLKFKLSGTKFLVSPNIASAHFTVLGMSMGLQVPGYKELNSSLFEKLLKNLLSPDFDNLDEALLAILSGDFTVNPFTGFGPGGGGVGGSDGDGGGTPGGGNQGESGYEGNNAASGAHSNTPGASAGNIQTAVSQPTLETQSPVIDGSGNGKTPNLMPAGEFDFPVEPKDTTYQVKQKHSSDATKNKDLGYIPTSLLNEHFSKSGNAYYSKGFLLAANETYYVHVLNQDLKSNSQGANHGIIHWYVGNSPQSVKHLQLPLSALNAVVGNMPYNQLKQIFTDKKKANWIREFCQIVGDRGYALNENSLLAAKDPIVLFHSDEAQIAAAVRFHNQMDYTLIIAGNNQVVSYDIPNINLLDSDAKKRELLTIISKHENTTVGIFERDNKLMIYTGCDPIFKKEFLYESGSSVPLKETTCLPVVAPPDPTPKPITKAITGIPPGGVTDKNGCPLTIKADGNKVVLSCPGQLPYCLIPFAIDGATLFKNSGGTVQWNTPEATLYKLAGKYSSFQYQNGGASTFLWISYDENENFKVSKLELEKNGIPPWSRINPENFEANKGVQGAFSLLESKTAWKIKTGAKLKNVKFIEDDGVSVFVTQYENEDATEYWIFAADKSTGKQIEYLWSSGVAPYRINNFVKNLKANLR